MSLLQQEIVPQKSLHADAIYVSVRFGKDCHSSCPDRTYNVDETMTCVPCVDAQCLNCDPSQCYWCEEGSYVLGKGNPLCGLMTVPEKVRDLPACSLRWRVRAGLRRGFLRGPGVLGL